jgi:hypothetical protein
MKAGEAGKKERWHKPEASTIEYTLLQKQLGEASARGI